MSDLPICSICGEKIECPKNKKQMAHEVCVYASDAARTFDNLGKNTHKANAIAVLKKLAFALTGLEANNESPRSEEEVRDDIILNHQKILDVIQKKFKVDLSENKSDIISKKFELLQPFFRIETIGKEVGALYGYTFLGINKATYNLSRKNLHVPKTWDAHFIRLGIRPSYIRTGRGEVFLSDHSQ